jgi:hypothetical protein
MPNRMVVPVCADRCEQINCSPPKQRLLEIRSTACAATAASGELLSPGAPPSDDDRD